MNWIDYIIIAIILISAVASLMRGFLREILSLVVWVVAVGVGYFFHPYLSAYMPWIEVESLRTLAAFTALFLVTMILGALLSYLIGSLFEKAGISGTDRLFGGIFGAVRGAVLIVLLVLMAGMMPLDSQPWWQASALIGHFVEAAAWLKAQLPDNIAAYFPHI